MGMQRVERGLERMVEGVFSRRARHGIRPIEFGRRLIREMDDQRSVDVKGRRIVPNDFTVHVTSQDRRSLADIEQALTTELAEAAREYARDEGYHFMGPIAVRLDTDDTQRTGRFAITALLKQGADPAPPAQYVAPAAAAAPAHAGAAAAPAAAASTAGSTTGALVMPDGTRHTLGGTDGPTRIGRMSECEVTISDSNVSRRHAEIKPAAGGLVVADLGSTNGTLVNGARLAGEHVLRHGDVITIGATSMRFEAS